MTIRALCVQGFLATTMFLCIADTASADDCKLKEVASLDVIVGDHGEVLVPVGLENFHGYLSLDIATPTSTLTRAAADSLQLKQETIPPDESFYFNGVRAKFAAYAALMLGNASGKTMFVIAEGKFGGDARTSGILAYDILKNFDIELDLSHKKVNLFSHDHCPGKVVYWTHTAAIAAVSFKIREMSTLMLPMQLDGKDVEAQLETRMPYTVLHRRAARKTFGLGASTSPAVAGMTDAGQQAQEDDSKPYNFKTLSVDGINIVNPVIYPYGQDSTASCNGTAHEEAPPLRNETHRELLVCYGTPDLMLGRPELEKLHIFIALQEHMLYATAADAQ